MITLPTRRTAALILLCIVPAFFASNNIAARLAQGVIEPAALSFWRWTIATALLAPFVAVSLLRKLSELRSELVHIFFLGLFGMTVVSVTTYAGASTTTASNIGLIYAAAPAAIIVLDWMVRGVSFRFMQVVGLVLSVAGILVIILQGDFTALQSLRFAGGDLVICAGMLAWAIYSVLLKHWPTHMTVIERTTLIMVAGAVTSFPLAFIEAGSLEILPASETAQFIALAVGVLAGAVTVTSHVFITGELGPQTSVILLYLIPLYNILLAWLLLGEELQIYQSVGGVLVLAGVGCAMRRAATLAPERAVER